MELPRVSWELHHFRRRVVEEDFPHLRPDAIYNMDRVLAVVGQMRADNQAAWADAAADRTVWTACKTPAAQYPHAVRYMRRMAGLTADGSDDTNLLDLAHDLANAKSSEKRSYMQDRFKLRASENGEATLVPPIATKEMLAMFEIEWQSHQLSSSLMTSWQE